jgi:recombination protein RecR
MAAIQFPESVTALVESLRALPGIGPRSAERIAIWLLQNPKADPAQLATALTRAKEEVMLCPVCGFFATGDRCSACAHPNRQPLLCVVEQPTDVLPMERSGVFQGRYHCLGGRLSPLDNVTPDDLRLAGLPQRIEAEGIVEVILALGADVEGEATAGYISDMIGTRCRVSRLAQGLPVGGGLEHADSLTLARAFEGRR